MPNLAKMPGRVIGAFEIGVSIQGHGQWYEGSAAGSPDSRRFPLRS